MYLGFKCNPPKDPSSSRTRRSGYDLFPAEHYALGRSYPRAAAAPIHYLQAPCARHMLAVLSTLDGKVLSIQTVTGARSGQNSFELFVWLASADKQII